MTTLFTNWHFMRILRAGIATYAFIEVYRTGDWMLFAIGSIFALQAIFDIGPPIRPEIAAQRKRKILLTRRFVRSKLGYSKYSKASIISR